MESRRAQALKQDRDLATRQFCRLLCADPPLEASLRFLLTFFGTPPPKGYGRLNHHDVPC